MVFICKDRTPYSCICIYPAWHLHQCLFILPTQLFCHWENRAETCPVSLALGMVDKIELGTFQPCRIMLVPLGGEHKISSLFDTDGSYCTQ